VCIVDATGKVVRETKVETRPEALVKFFKSFDLPLTRIGLEAGPLSHWLYAGLTDAGFEKPASKACGRYVALQATRGRPR
jgi:transposase